MRPGCGQRYASHYDAFSPAEYSPQKSRRMTSFLLYLSDVPEGGETMFPFENGLKRTVATVTRTCRGNGCFIRWFRNPTSPNRNKPVI